MLVHSLYLYLFAWILWAFSESLIHFVFGWADAECTLACHLTAPLWPTPLTHAAGFQNVRADPSITNPSTTTWLDPPHPHPTHSMWSLLVLTTPSTALTRSNQAPTIHSLHQEVSLIILRLLSCCYGDF